MTPKPASEMPAPSDSNDAHALSPETLQESLDRLKTTLEALPDLLFVLDREGRIYDFHAPNLERLYVPPEQFLGRTMDEVLPEPAVGIVNRAIADAVAHGHHRGSVYPLRTPAGDQWFEISIAAQGDPRTAAGRLVAIVRDITERKRAEEALKTSESRYRELFDFAVDGILLGSPDGIITDANACMCALAGRTRAELIGTHVGDLFDPDTLDRTPLRFDLLQQGEIVVRERRIHRPGASEVFVEIHSKMMPDGTYQSIYRDITARRQAEAALRESEVRFSESARQSRTVVWEVDADGFFTYVSPVVEDVLGYRPEELVGKLHFSDLYPEEQRAALRAAAGDMFRRREPFRNFESMGRAKDGRPVWVVTNGIPLLNADGTLRGYRGGNMDITARKLAEEALREGEQKYRLLTEGMKDVVWTVDVAAQRFLYVSPSVEKLRGYTPEEVLAQPFAEALVPEQRQELAERLAHSLAEFQQGLLTADTYFALEILQPCKNGARIPSEVVCHLLRNEQTGRIELHGVTRDITDRKRMEEALRESESRFAQSTKASHAYVWEVDAYGVYTFISPVVQEVLGYAPDEIIGHKHFYDFHPPEDLEAFKEATLQAFRQAQPVSGFENPNVAKDGRLVWVSSSATPLFKLDGSLRGYQGVDIDITARKQAENALRESESRFDQSAKHSRTYVWEMDAEGVFTFISHAVEDVLGYRPDEIIGKLHFYDLHPAEGREAFLAAAREVIQRQGEFTNLENPCQAKDGRIVWVSTNAQPLLNPDGSLRGYRGSDLDITGRRRAEEALRESEQKYRILTEGMKDVVWVLDVEAQRFLYVSPSVVELRGYTPAEILAQPLAEAWLPAERERLFALLQGYVADFLAGKIDDTTYVPIEFLQPCKDGSTVPSEAICRLVRNEQNGRLELHGVTRDISRRVQAEAAFRESETRFNNVAQTSRSYVWEIDADGLLTYISPVVEDVLGYRPEEIVGRKHFYDFQPPEYQGELKTAMLRLFHQAQPIANFENVNQTKDGRRVWVSSSATPLFHPDGSLRGYQGVDIDITARKQAEEALRESETRFDQSARQSRTFLWEVDANGLYTFASDVVADVLGYRPDELVGKLHFDDLFPEETRAAVRAEIAAAIQHRQSFRDYENLCLAKDGRRVWVITSAMPLLDADGSLRGYRGSDTDITKRKQAEEALRESEARLRTLNDNLPGGLVYQMDTGVDGRERRLLAVSKGVERMHGVTAEEALRNQKTFYLQIVPEDQARVAELEARAIATLTPFRAEVRCRLPSGEIRWIYVSSAPRRLPNGHLVWDGIELDVTERKQAEEALQQSEIKYRRLHEGMRDAFVSTDMQGHILESNEAFLMLTGYSGDEIRDLTYLELTPAKWHAREAKILAEQVIPRGFSDVYQKEYTRKDGSVVPIELRTILIRDAFGNPTGMWALVRDITERKRVERALQRANDELERRVAERTAALVDSQQALKQSEAQFRQMTDIIQEVFWLIDAQTGRALYVSPAFETIWGRPPRKEDPGVHAWIESLHPDDQERALQSFRRGVATGRFDPLEVRVLRPDGAIRWIEVHGWMLHPDPGEPLRVAGVMRDITERRRLEAEILRASEAERQRIGRDLHDSLGQALTGIGYLAEALREELNRHARPEADDLQKLGHLIEDAAAKSHAMARGMLLTDLNRGGLAAALQELALRTQELFGIPCRYEGPAEFAGPAEDATGQLYRIAQEAATNAAKHAKAKDIEIRLAQTPAGLLLTVRDSGTGLASKKHKRAGLGLEIMKYRANQIGATLEIASTRNQGTTVSCRLPLAAPPRR